jgi:hypothetical protein
MMDEKIYQRQMTKQALADSFMVKNSRHRANVRMVKDPKGILSHWRN